MKVKNNKKLQNLKKKVLLIIDTCKLQIKVCVLGNGLKYEYDLDKNNL